MPTRFDLLIKDVQAVDSLNKFNVQSDIGIKGSKITAVAQGLNKEEASTVIEGNFLTAIPGLIDTHVHLGISSCGFNMLTRAGVTTALDMSGTSQDIATQGRSPPSVQNNFQRPGFQLIDTMD